MRSVNMLVAINYGTFPEGYILKNERRTGKELKISIINTKNVGECCYWKL